MVKSKGLREILIRFEADRLGDLRSGELFVAKWVQTSAKNGGRANIEWISLGHATENEIKEGYFDQKITFNDIFEVGDPNNCPSDFTSINTSDGHECLKVKQGMEKAASRLETRRYAAMKGGTTEFSKMEGITFDPDNRIMYIAMSDVSQGMEDNKKYGVSNDQYDKGGPNHIRLPFNRCGIVYGLKLNEDYVATEMFGLLQGLPVTKSYGAPDDSQAYDPNGPFAKNNCSLDGIANPDNITFIPKYKTLIIGEDSGGGHQNDMVWTYSIETKKLARIQTTPYGSETTSVYFYPNINGWGYLMSVVQHPYGESDQDKTVAGSEETRGYTGYIGPFPAMDR